LPTEIDGDGEESQMVGSRARAGLFFLVAFLAPASALAGAPDPSCLIGCPGMLSDQIAFDYTDPNGFEIVATLDFCGFCNTLAAGVFELVGSMHVDFGLHYTGGSCDPAEGLVTFPINVPTIFVEASPPPTGEMKYVPVDPGRVFPRDPGAALRTRCVDPAYLDYSIPNLALIGSLGARTPSFPDPATLTLPTNVRGTEDDGSLASTNDLPSFSFREDLTFAFTESKPAGSLLRFWPDGSPFRLGPAAIDYAHDSVALTFDSAGPPAYEPKPPDENGLPGGAPGLFVVGCSGCTASQVYNGGYLESAAWQPSAAFFDSNGFDVDLSLPPTESVVYEPVFPRRLQITLEGPATVTVRDSAISGGGFTGGQLQLVYRDGTGGRRPHADIPTGSSLDLQRGVGPGLRHAPRSRSEQRSRAARDGERAPG
jgi:hypothetical protein